jgi:hypothetical protein
MDYIIKKASTLTIEEKTSMGIIGIPDNWVVESYPYMGIIPAGFEQISDVDLAILKENTKASYDAWLAPMRPIYVPHQEPPQNVIIKNIDVSTSEKALKVTPTKLEGSSTLLVSHNFCDKTTWYTESALVTSEILSASGVGNLVFTSLHSHWIDLEHGKLPYEHRLAPTYKPVISLDDVPLTGNAASGFTINYENGSVTFLSEQTGVVKARYHYAQGSGWIIAPDAGKILKIIGTSVKFTEDVELDMAHAISFQLYIMGGTVPYGSPTIYNNMNDVIKCSMGESYVVPAFGTFTKNVIVLPFDYITSKDLPSSIGALIKIRLLTSNPIPGTFGMVAVHCISVPE